MLPEHHQEETVDRVWPGKERRAKEGAGPIQPRHFAKEKCFGPGFRVINISAEGGRKGRKKKLLSPYRIEEEKGRSGLREAPAVANVSDRRRGFGHPQLG